MAILPWYATVEDVSSALDIRASAYAVPQIGAALEAAARNTAGLCHRSFYPLLATRYFDFPNGQTAASGRIWFDRDLISLTSFTSGGVTVPGADYFLEPVNSGPPYNRLEINRASTSALSSNSGTPQRSLVLTGLWGYNADEASAGTAATAMASTSTTVLNISGDPMIGIGTLLRVDSERMIVTGRTWLTSGQTLQTPLTASLANQALVVTDGTAFTVGETLLLDQERMTILEIIGNTLTVRRAAGGSVLATHAGSTIQASRALTVTRGVLGTVAATHLNAAPLFRHLVPGLVQKLNVAYALDTILQEQSGYARTSGSGDNERQMSASAIRALEEDVHGRYGRKVRMRAV